MAAPAGIAAQLGFVAESVYGTAVTVTRFQELVQESLRQEIERVESRGLRAGRRVLLSTQWAAGKRRVVGDVELEAASLGQGLLWKHAMGTVNTTGTNPYTHTCSPGDMTGLSLTVQVGRPDSGGTVRAFTYAGCKIRGWELSCAAGEIPLWTLDMVAQSEDTGTALASASYPSGLTPFVFTQGTLSIAGSPVGVKEFSLSADNALADDRWFIQGAGTIKEPLENGQRSYTGSLTADFESLTAYNRYVNGTEAALSLVFTAGASSSLTITANVRFDGDTPVVSGPEMLELPLRFKCVASAADATAITVALVNTDVAP